MNAKANEQLIEFYERNRNRARLLISCPDQPGIVAAVSQFLFNEGANIIQSDQYSTDPEGGRFFMRVAFEIPGLETREKALCRAFEPVAARFAMDWRISFAYRIKRMAIFVSKQEHCLLELLWQLQSGDLVAEVPLVISNHEDHRELVESFGIPFYHIPVSKETKRAAEAEQLELLADNVDLIVLARYMQVLSPEFVAHYPNRIINIHHSFLPAFVGSKPYERAYERGVKLIGATSHYVTNELDAGPIIEQDVSRVNHRHNVQDLKRIGRHIERVVLARAVKWHLEDRIIPYNNKTVVFV
ncbi:formyltetrahydrofolate deformylase [Caldalkalibacillus thermarum TA2.A1]|uniref:Formyltetrahydrofolate deformylase n=1 Tax=Caldalkalibacillus thermarum (strain TA2.A1) TaxID=986075 RepID=F5LBB8_CALTT|nr:formyltetrahydrofolate deformylase [Caldalkalibacillus thermarum]EGL81364.1 formyltetrahydrofolate deformylase [Caldalkalibacillus thermarum TA2.A1]QZT33876.1 formyltetrahydrofolate deformylase [Caldalkalibacillus thermarum TA2.A1]GGK23850.1 formyltetrahydrofolate deformylase [Caldalkalibacillus thermarum]